MYLKTKAAAERSTSGHNSWGWLETIAFVAYLALVAIGLGWHEPWADEAQAWLMARDMSWSGLVLHGVRYEGSPALWHSILWVLVRLHVTFNAARWIGGIFAASGVFVLLRFAPFPRFLRLILPFTFFMAYQDAVITRSYVLFALLAFSVTASIQHRRQRPILTAVLLGLLANVSVHGLVLSVALAAVSLLVWRRAAISRRNLVACLLLLFSFWIFSVGTTLPPKDIGFPAGRNIEHSWSKISGGSPQSLQDTVLPNELAPVEIPPVHHKQPSVLRKLVRLLSLITYPLSTIRILGLATCAALLVLAFKTHGGTSLGWLAILPYLLMLVVFQSLYLAPRHAGTLFVAFLISSWLAWPRERPQKPAALVLAVLLGVISVEQITWTGRAIWADVHGPYSGDVQTAAFLHQRLTGHRAAGFYYHSIGPLPYFSHNHL